MKRGKKKQNLKIKPMIYTLMEIRKMEYLQRNGQPIPQELLEKKQAEEERVAKEAAIKNVIEHKVELPKINEEDERIYAMIKEHHDEDKDDEAGNVQFRQESMLILNANQEKATAPPEQEKVSLIKIGVTPKLENPKEDAPKVEQTKVEILKSDTPKISTPQAQTSKANTPKVDTPKSNNAGPSPKTSIKQINTQKKSTFKK